MTRDVHQHELTPEGGLDRRQLLKRLGVGGAIVWTVPLLAQSPAAADHTTCNWTEQLFQWDQITLTVAPGNSSLFSGSTTVLDRSGVHPDVTLTVSDLMSGNTRGGNDHDVFNGPWGEVGAASDRFIQLHNGTSNNNGDGRTVTFTFSEPVQDVRFWITDIDYLSSWYDDRVWMTASSGDPFAVDLLASTNIIGAGTGSGANALRRSNSQNVDVADGLGTVEVYHEGSLESFTVDFRNGSRADTSDQGHWVFLGPISFETCEEPPAP